MELYHCTHRHILIGDIIEPGNWGYKIFEVGPTHNAWAREMALEAVRAWKYTSKPSRLKSSFACDNYETIQCYKSKNIPNGYIYKVEIVSTECLIHKGDFNAIQPLPGKSETMWQIADAYWQYKLRTDVAEWPNVDCSELVIASSLRVVEIVSVPDMPKN